MAKLTVYYGVEPTFGYFCAQLKISFVNYYSRFNRRPKNLMTRLLKPLFIFIFLIPSLNSIGQQLTVFNVTCLELVQNVAIFNLGQTKSVLTNENGVADISGFEAPDPLIFLHTAYFTLIIDVPELMEMDYRVGLAARTIQLDQIIISASK